MKKSLLVTMVGSVLAACGGGSSTSPSTSPETPVTPTPVSTLKIGLLPDTQGGGDNVSMHPMRAVLEKERELGVDIVIPVGDLTDQGTAKEFEQWTSVAEAYRDAGIEFLPLMGNHEDSFAYSVQWIETMKDYIPKDAVHMVGAQYLNYYVVRDNVLIVLLKYYNLPIAFEWIKDVVMQHEGKVDHIVIASHDGLVGAKYGETREMIVEGVRGDNLLMNQWDEIRAFFAKHDVIWVQGHEHMYQRSVIQAPIHVDPGSWTTADGNYRLPQYTQIMSGNASYKGYEFRYGERELVQRIIQQKMNTMSNGSPAFDANASVLTFQGDRVDYESWFTPHTVTANEQGPKELAQPDWQLLDRFSRTSNRCERIVFPNSIPANTRPVMYFDASFVGNDCTAPDGTVAKLVGGTNNTFNRVDSRARSMEVTPGFSRAEDGVDLLRLAYQYLYQYHQPWTPNLNGAERLVLNGGNLNAVDIPATTTDLKKHVMLSWQAGTADTLSDVLIVSGIQQHTGIYASEYGAIKDLEQDTGLPGSQPDGSAKQPHTLPSGASKEWDLRNSLSDRYAIALTAPAAVAADAALGWKTENGWEPLVSEACVLNMPFDESLLAGTPARAPECNDSPVVGVDLSGDSARWWAILQQDAELAMLSK
ncbi:metallophosphoesterase [Alcanivorax sp. REN37]|uniref:Metallophosphoesterase n=1 Tax=Isoalcanivorax beigongshangi TaxID=3238810 RepID=A0ABV4AE79_9GAMM